MVPKANPLCKPGERNIYCPYYEDCLDYAVDSEWEFWDCSCCPHKVVHRPFNASDGGPVEEDIAYYNVIFEEFDEAERKYGAFQ